MAEQIAANWLAVRELKELWTATLITTPDILKIL